MRQSLGTGCDNVQTFLFTYTYLILDRYPRLDTYLRMGIIQFLQ